MFPRPRLPLLPLLAIALITSTADLQSQSVDNFVVSPSAISMNVTTDDPGAKPTSLSVLSMGKAMSYIVSATSDRGWLAVIGDYPLGYNMWVINAGHTEVDIFGNTRGLTPGTYKGSITISSSAAGNSPVTVPVVLTVTPAYVDYLQATPAQLSFSVEQGATAPSPQNVSVTSTLIGVPLSFSIINNASWITVSPTSGATPGSISVTVNPARLSVGTSSTTISLTGPDASNNVQIPVSVTVSPKPTLAATPVGLTFSASAGDMPPAAQIVKITSSGNSLSYAASTSNNWLTIDTANGATPGSLAISVNPQVLAVGTYNGAVTVSAADAGNSAVTIPVTLTVNANGPSITSADTAGGTVDSAQNSWIEIKGANLAPADIGPSGFDWSTAPDFKTGRMPVQLRNVTVQVNGKPAFVYWISPNQINALTPLDDTQGPVEVTVTNGDYTSLPLTVNLKPAAPSFLLLAGTKYPVAQHADYSLLGPGSMFAPEYSFTPATAGETIILYATGFGLPSAALVSGSATQFGVLPNLPSIRIGGVAANVTFAALISPGLYQINVMVPATLTTGDQPITAVYGGVRAQDGLLLSVR